MTLEEAETRLSRAQGHFDRMRARYWETLGWGTAEEIMRAMERCRSAKRTLEAAKRRIERLARPLHGH